MKKKFDWNTIVEIRRRYAELRERKKNEIRGGRTDRVSTYTLCADYDCAQSTIHGIVSRRMYKERPNE